MAIINPMSGAMIPAMMGVMAPFTKDPLAAAVTALSLNGVNAYLSHQKLIAAGDFDTEYLLRLPTATAIYTIDGVEPENGLYYWNDGSIRLYLNNAKIAEIPQAQMVVGSIIRLGLSKSSGVYSLHLNGNLIDSGASALPFESLGYGKIFSSNTAYLDAELFSVDRKSGFTDTAGNPLNPLYYPGKHKDLGYVPNERAPLGAELIPGADISAFVATNDASKSGDSFTNTEQYRGIYYDVPGLVVGQRYAVKIECDYIDSGSTEAYLYVSNAFGTIAESVVLQSGTTKWIVFTAIAVTQRIYLRRSALGTANISLVSLRSAPGYALKNGTAPDGSDSQSYTKMADGRLSGKELSTLGELSLSQGQQSSVLDLGELIEVEIKKAAGVEVTASGSWVGSGSESITVTTRYISFRNTTATTEVFTPSVRAVLSYAPGANT